MRTKDGRYVSREAAIKAYDAGRTVYRITVAVGVYQGFYTKREAIRLASLVGGEAYPVDPRAAYFAH